MRTWTLCWWRTSAEWAKSSSSYRQRCEGAGHRRPSSQNDFAERSSRGSLNVGWIVEQHCQPYAAVPKLRKAERISISRIEV